MGLVQEIGNVGAGIRSTIGILKKRVRSWRDVVTLMKNAHTHYSHGGLRLLKSRLMQAEAPQNIIEYDYGKWLKKYGQLTHQDRTLILQRIANLKLRPKISVIMTFRNADLRWLRTAVESVRSQLYSDWEICISDDASTASGIHEEFLAYAREDKRICVFSCETNGHSPANSNSAFALASGDFIVLLDADDLLSEDALYRVAEEINAYPDADLIFSDEDKIDIEGRRFEPYFKPDWNPALILSQNFFSHLGIFRRSLVEKVGGFREGFEANQDYDLVLRCADASDFSRIRHIPRVLYHSRAVRGSTDLAEGTNEKSNAWEAGALAIAEYLGRKNILGEVTRACGIYYQVNYAVPRDLPKVSIIVPSTARLSILRSCISGILGRTTYPNFEVLIAVSEKSLQNAEQAAYLRELEEIDKIRVCVYRNRDFNYSWTNNWAAKQATGSIFCLLNDDVEIVTTDWLEKFVARLHLDRVGAVGAMLYYPNDKIQHAGVTLGLWGVAGHAFRNLPRGSEGYFCRAALEQDLSCVTAACMALRREAFEELQGFNEEFAIAFNDVDLCIRLREKGWRIIWVSQVEHYHNESTSAGRHDSRERTDEFNKEVALIRKLWGPTLDNDPFYNPNLSLWDTNTNLAFPPRVAKFPI